MTKHETHDDSGTTVEPGGERLQARQEGLRARALPPADRARPGAGVGPLHRSARRHPLRGPRRRRQGRHDQAHHPVPQPTRRPHRRAAVTHRAAAQPVVLPALHRAPSGGRRDRALRPQLVQPRRRRARHGVLHRRRVPTLPAPGSDLRADAGRGGHRTAQVLVQRQPRRAGTAVPVAPARPASALEALTHGRRVDQAVGGLLARQGRDVRAHRHPRGALVRGGGRRQAACPDQHDRPPADDAPLWRGRADPGEAAQAATVTGIPASRQGALHLRPRPRGDPRPTETHRRPPAARCTAVGWGDRGSQLSDGETGTLYAVARRWKRPQHFNRRDRATLDRRR